MKHSFTIGRPVYVSIRKIARQTGASRNTLRRLLDNLIGKGYITDLDAYFQNGATADRAFITKPANPKAGRKNGDLRKWYDVQGIYKALGNCLILDPKSAFNKIGADGKSERERGQWKVSDDDARVLIERFFPAINLNQLEGMGFDWDEEPEAEELEAEELEAEVDA